MKDRKGKTAVCAMAVALRLSFVLLLLCLSSCSSHKPPSTQPASDFDRQEQALKDPFGYSPGVDRSDISGGDLGHLDKNAMKKDVDHVLNP